MKTDWLSCVIGVFALVLLAAGTAKGHHDSTHEEVAIGQWTTVDVYFVACDTREQAELVFAAHKKHGFAGAIGALSELAKEVNRFGQPVCGAARRKILPLKKVKVGLLELPNGMLESTIVLVDTQDDKGLWAILHGIKVRRGPEV